jgi:hypothetical protein
MGFTWRRSVPPAAADGTDLLQVSVRSLPSRHSTHVSKIATPVSAVEGHTVFCTPNTDDWTGGVTRPQPPGLEFLSANRLAQILTT